MMPATIPSRGGSTESASSFQLADAGERRLKLFLWGDSGAGKSTLARHFPSIVFIDLEDGAEHHAGALEFDRPKVTTADKIMQAVDGLSRRPKRKEPA